MSLFPEHQCLYCTDTVPHNPDTIIIRLHWPIQSLRQNLPPNIIIMLFWGLHPGHFLLSSPNFMDSIILSFAKLNPNPTSISTSIGLRWSIFPFNPATHPPTRNSLNFQFMLVSKTSLEILMTFTRQSFKFVDYFNWRHQIL